MKYAVLSDIHANLEAFQAVLAHCARLGVSRFIFLGDIVGYNASPLECLQLLRTLDLVGVVKGNHDEYASNGDTVMADFNPYARDAVLWTQNQLDEESLSYLQKLPYFMHIRGIKSTIVHATLDGPSRWGYIFDTFQVQDNFHYQFNPVCFCGHSHVPVAYCKPNFIGKGGSAVERVSFWNSTDEDRANGFRTDVSDEITLNLECGAKYLINVGSVGQPRNHDPRASFAVYDPEENTVTRYRVPYDIATAQKKVRDAGLPELLAARLETGE